MACYALSAFLLICWTWYQIHYPRVVHFTGFYTKGKNLRIALSCIVLIVSQHGAINATTSFKILAAFKDYFPLIMCGRRGCYSCLLCKQMIPIHNICKGQTRLLLILWLWIKCRPFFYTTNSNLTHSYVEISGLYLQVAGTECDVYCKGYTALKSGTVQSISC